ncbi:putative zinc-binding protein [Methanofollis fontis]|uniref:Zinc-binding protein n=1 Tax=Methanofollis fontis TaxID=2052832 RepID=A0A483CN72_9EURY|nr:putative zinc-binding protein [Methanofollis fontis]TAJ44072.1 zinc-binding protein [Methanofollis fontis]
MGFTLVVCSGVSSTGRLTAQTGAVLLHRCGRIIEACVPATRPKVSLEDSLHNAEKIFVLDGCGDCCGMKRVQALGVEPDLHVVATSCGIEKRGMEEPHYTEIEMLLAACRRRLDGDPAG